MATTAKIARDEKLAVAKAANTPKLRCRHRNRCFRCGRPRGFLRKFLWHFMSPIDGKMVGNDTKSHHFLSKYHGNSMT